MDVPSIARLRGGGCAASKTEGTEGGPPVPVRTSPAASGATAPPPSELVQLPSGGFACETSPLFQEYLALLGDAAGEPAPVGDITPNDALLVIDMQGDFVPKSASNRDGGRFGVAEGDHIIRHCVQLIDHVRARATGRRAAPATPRHRRPRARAARARSLSSAALTSWRPASARRAPIPLE